MSYIEKEKLIKADIASIENRVRHAFNQGYDLGFKDGKKRAKPQEQEPTIKIDYRRAFKIACELLNGDVLYGVDADKIYELMMKKDGVISSSSYEEYILNHLQELDQGQYASEPTTKNDLPHCQYTDKEIAKSFIEDVEAVKEQLPCGELMDFPETFEKFAKQYQIIDKQEVYTNGAELIPVFRVKQWLEHISTTKNDLGKAEQETDYTWEDVSSVMDAMEYRTNSLIENIKSEIIHFANAHCSGDDINIYDVIKVIDDCCEDENLTTKNDLGVDCVSRQFMYDLGATCIAYRNDKQELIPIISIDELPSVTPQKPTDKCKWIKYDHRTMCPKEHMDVDNPYWRIPENRMETLKYCPYCGKEIEVEE